MLFIYVQQLADKDFLGITVPKNVSKHVMDAITSMVCVITAVSLAGRDISAVNFMVYIVLQPMCFLYVYHIRCLVVCNTTSVISVFYTLHLFHVPYI